MLPIFVYLYNTYHHPGALPDSLVLAQRLAEVGFQDEEILLALDWLSESKQLKWSLLREVSPTATRLYTQQEHALFGAGAIGKLESLVGAGKLNAEQREMFIEQAFAVGEMPISDGDFHAILLMLLWSDDDEQAANEALIAEACLEARRVLH
ncbi:MAG: DUF494 family protein [Burkholderiaceae bacterium]|nr:MAG: DUF494 family protein [Burkholderiaceae bacterium]